METITLKIFEFSALKPEAKEQAIQDLRSSYYEDNDFAAWAIEDDYLLNPKKFSRKGIDVIGNLGKKIYFDTGRSWYLQIDQAIDILNEDLFLKFLNIPKKLRDKIYYTFENSGRGSTEINIEENEVDYEFTDQETDILETAKQIFSNYVDYVLRSILADIEYRFSDEAIIEDIEANEMKFLETGKKIYYV